MTMRWTHRVIICVAPIHVVLGVLGVLMIYPMAASTLPTALAVLVAEPIAAIVERIWRSRKDPEHRKIAWLLWIVAALSAPTQWQQLQLGIGCAVLWRFMPRDGRAAAAGGLVVAAICAMTWIWGYSGNADLFSVLYTVLYGATALALASFAIERAISLYVERREQDRPMSREKCLG